MMHETKPVRLRLSILQMECKYVSGRFAHHYLQMVVLAENCTNHSIAFFRHPSSLYVEVKDKLGKEARYERHCYMNPGANDLVILPPRQAKTLNLYSRGLYKLQKGEHAVSREIEEKLTAWQDSNVATNQEENP